MSKLEMDTKQHRPKRKTPGEIDRAIYHAEELIKNGGKKLTWAEMINAIARLKNALRSIRYYARREDYLEIVFTGSHESGLVFVEIEDDEGHSVRHGKWRTREDGYTVLRIPRQVNV